MTKRIQMEFDSDGVKYSIKLDGDISLQKLTHVYEMMSNIGDDVVQATPDTVGAKIWNVIEKYFGNGGFTSNLILEKYEDEYNEPIKLSAISTYLARYSARMKLNRRKTGREWTYSLTNHPITHTR